MKARERSEAGEGKVGGDGGGEEGGGEREGGDRVSEWFRAMPEQCSTHEKVGWVDGGEGGEGRSSLSELSRRMRRLAGELDFEPVAEKGPSSCRPPPRTLRRIARSCLSRAQGRRRPVAPFSLARAARRRLALADLLGSQWAGQNMQ